MKYLLLLSIAILGCAPPNIPVNNTCGYRWYSTPVYFYFSPGVPQVIKDGAINAANRWNSVTGHNFIQIYQQEYNLPIGLNNINSIVYFPSGQWTGAPNQEANTTFWWNGGNLVFEADIALNGSWSIGNQPNQVDAESLFLHEFGHSLGLMHNETNVNSIMYPTLSTGQKRIVFQPDDLADISCRYN